MKNNIGRSRVLAVFAAGILLLLPLTACKSRDPGSSSETSDVSETDSSGITTEESDGGYTLDTTYSSSSSGSLPSDAGTTKSPNTKNTNSSPVGSDDTTPPQEESSATESNTVSVTIPEGYTVDQIAILLENKGVCSKDGYLNAINTFDYSGYYPGVVNCVKDVPNLCYKYEGYQFPDTYTFYKKMKPEDAAGKLMRGAQDNIIKKNYSYSGMTLHQIVTLASIIEQEAQTKEDRALVSSVFHNRLKAGMQLQADSTISYLLYYIVDKSSVDYYKYYYNTYRCPDLPAGPICNPGTEALDAAANPADSDYYYFFSDHDGVIHYSKTLEEHNQLMQQYGITSSTPSD